MAQSPPLDGPRWHRPSGANGQPARCWRRVGPPGRVASDAASDATGYTGEFPGGYDLDRTVPTITHAIRAGENVALNRRNLDEAAQAELRATVEARPDWIGKVVLGP